MSRPRTALVLSGGGARGAYEVGIIRYLREELPQEVRKQVHFDVITGSSVGALNGCFLAATADDPDGQGRRLAELWQGVALEDLLEVKFSGLMGALANVYKAVREGGRESGEGILGSMFRAGIVADIVRDKIPWSQIERNIQQGFLHGVAVSAMEVVSGHTVTFVQRHEGRDYPMSEDPSREVIPTTLGPSHALASAAIPLLFPCVKLNGSYYCDGGLRQNTPISPALRMGANRVFVISLRHARSREEVKAAHEAAVGVYPDPFMLMGKVLNALLLDRVEYDLSVMRRINRILETGIAAYGPDFRWIVGEAVAGTRGAAYRKVEAFHVRPSRDVGVLAADFMRTISEERRKRLLPPGIMRRVAARESGRETDFMSYLMFDGAWATRLMELAMEDAHTQREELIAYFQGGPGNV